MDDKNFKRKPVASHVNDKLWLSTLPPKSSKGNSKNANDTDDSHDDSLLTAASNTNHDDDLPPPYVRQARGEEEVLVQENNQAIIDTANLRSKNHQANLSIAGSMPSSPIHDSS